MTLQTVGKTGKKTT